MLYLFFSIVSTAMLYIIFKVFDRKGVNPEAGIWVNYITSSVLALAVSGSNPVSFFQDSKTELGILGVVLGFGFITVFSLLGKTTQMLGVSGSTTVSRTSMVIPTAFSIFVLGENFSWWKVAGIAIALAAIYFTVHKPKSERTKNESSATWVIPMFAFIGTGVLDLLFKFAESNYMNSGQELGLATTIYIFAFLGASIYLYVTNTPMQSFKEAKTWIWGISLGIANFLGLYLFLLALTGRSLPGSQLFPLNSVGIVVISTLLSVVLFRERLSGMNALGFSLAILSILLIGFSDQLMKLIAG